MFIRTTLRWLEEEDAVSKELIDKDLLSITSKSSSSIRDLFTKLDWLPPSSTHRVSLLLHVGPVIHTRAVWRYVKSGDETPILPTEVAGVCEVGSIESLEV
jgi:hypothetical protein